MAQISVIIPCYNVEKYIDRCINSIINQSFGLDKLEIILVDDASTDSTLSKIKDWENKYPENIIVISYENNMRQGYARNLGLQYASSPYISFIDADDWIDCDFYETLYRYALSEDYDVTSCKFIREHFPNELSCNTSDTDYSVYSYHFDKITEDCYFGDITETGTNGEFGSCCTRLLKKDIILNNGILFPENMAYEDNLWGAHLRLYTSSFCVVDKVMYHYFINFLSTTTSTDSLTHVDRLDIEIMKLELYKSAGVFNVKFKEIENEFIRMYFLNSWYIFFTRYSFIPDIFNDMKEFIKLNFPDWYKNPLLDSCTPREKILLRMLNMNHDFSIEELTKIKLLYLESMVPGH